MYSIIHDKASTRFNEEAMDLVGLIKPVPPKVGVKAFSPEHYISGTFEESDIIEITSLGEVNHLGEEISKHFIHGKKLFGLIDAGYQNLNKLSESIYSHGKVSQHLSIEYIKDKLFEWVKEQWIAKSETTFIEELSASAEVDIVEHDIGFPISMLSVEDEFEIGDVVFRPITKDRFDGWFQNIIEASKEHVEIVRGEFEIIRKKMQGYTVAEVKVLAENKHAIMIGKEKVLKSLAILRALSYSNIHPKLTEGFNILGAEKNDGVTCIKFDENYVGSPLEYSEQNYKARTISKQDIEEIRRLGLGVINKVLSEPRKSDFQKKVLEALELYSKNNMLPDPQDKLIYILSAIESVLLKDPKEPIQKNLSERMALYIGKTYDQRIEIKINVEKIYNKRSKFLHHGSVIDESEMLTSFMKTAWIFIVKLIGDMDKYNTKQEFIEHIEVIKFS